MYPERGRAREEEEEELPPQPRVVEPVEATWGRLKEYWGLSSLRSWWGAVVVGVGTVGGGGVVGVGLTEGVGGGAVDAGWGVRAVDPTHGVDSN